MAIHSHLKLAMVGAAAVVAAAANQRYLADHTREESYVSVRCHLAAGDRVRQQDLQSVTLGGDLTAARQSLVLWSERALLIDRPVVRDLMQGDLILRSDTDSTVSGPFAFEADQYVFSAPIDSLRGFAKNLAIGDVVQFLIAHESPNGSEPRVEACGPLTVRALDKVQRQLDRDAMHKLRPTSITLSTPATADGRRPPFLGLLFAALADGRSARVVAIEHCHYSR